MERTNVTGQYQSLDAVRIVATVEQLSERIAARFPDAGLYLCVSSCSPPHGSQRFEVNKSSDLSIQSGSLSLY